MGNRFNIFSIAIALIMLGGCAHSDLAVYGAVDRSDKSMTVPPGNARLVGDIKQKLKDGGWTLVIDKGPTHTEGTANGTVALSTAQTYRTRYRLMLKQRRVGAAMLAYDLSVIDNQSGREVFAQSGRDRESDIVAKFMGALEGAR